ncbi:uncharacterized protein LOC111633239 [Centruroides sculpturatus]|uniref:uncharacterized protein LOC111633232 n=1 Tax=Centruroides sculpturatus TaxID=218467 RepID=UPI000C6D4124|nr:uncharacterized protein LOC111633232 [Centruroides sculpturatus]XP_023233544.1 uncharacterized protein LOC111633239 [Centruroides sculpturatus]
MPLPRHHRNLRRNPWYRGYMPYSYVPPYRLASYGCSVCLLGFGIVLLIGGIIPMILSKHGDELFKADDDPRFQDDFFKKGREDKDSRTKKITDIVYIVGLVLTCIGAVFIISSFFICIFAKCHMIKQTRRRKNLATATPLNRRPPSPGYYPHQPLPSSGYYPPHPSPSSGHYPQQPSPSSGYYPQQPPPPSYSYPQQYTLVPQQPVDAFQSQQTAPTSTYLHPSTEQSV